MSYQDDLLRNRRIFAGLSTGFSTIFPQAVENYPDFSVPAPSFPESSLENRVSPDVTFAEAGTVPRRQFQQNLEELNLSAPAAEAREPDAPLFSGEEPAALTRGVQAVPESGPVVRGDAGSEAPGGVTVYTLGSPDSPAPETSGQERATVAALAEPYADPEGGDLLEELLRRMDRDARKYPQQIDGEGGNF